jgi:hypothetical protein
MNVIREAQTRRPAKGDMLSQVQYIEQIFGGVAEPLLWKCRQNRTSALGPE